MSAGPKYEVRIQQLDHFSTKKYDQQQRIIVWMVISPPPQVPLGGREPSEETNQMLGAEVH